VCAYLQTTQSNKQTDTLKIIILVDSEIEVVEEAVFQESANSARVLSLDGRNHCYGYRNRVIE
jgi:hypothetical protein